MEPIHIVTAYVQKDAEAFREEWIQSTRNAQASSIRQNRKQLVQEKKRLDNIENMDISDETTVGFRYLQFG